MGHVQKVSLVPGKVHEMKTLSLKPLLFGKDKMLQRNSRPIKKVCYHVFHNLYDFLFMKHTFSYNNTRQELLRGQKSSIKVVMCCVQLVSGYPNMASIHLPTFSKLVTTIE